MCVTVYCECVFVCVYVHLWILCGRSVSRHAFVLVTLSSCQFVLFHRCLLVSSSLLVASKIGCHGYSISVFIDTDFTYVDYLLIQLYPTIFQSGLIEIKI